MKLYNSVGPNPQVVRMFIAEKGMDIPKQEVDLMGGENRRPPFNSTVNVAGQLPALELDNGKTISEITAICEYLEEVGKGPALIGATPEERAETRMWVRRIDLNICEPMANGFRAAEGRAIFANRIKLVGADGDRPRSSDLAGWPTGRTHLGGGRAVHSRRHPSLLLPCLRSAGRTADPGRGWKHPGLVRAHQGPAQRRGLRPVSRGSLLRSTPRRGAPGRAPAPFGHERNQGW
jgi:glutathione S-transferase